MSINQWRPEKLADTEFEDVKLEKVTLYGSVYELSTSHGCLGVDRHLFKITPLAGMTVRFYGRGFGSPVRGVDVGGVEVYYRTEAEENAQLDEWLANSKRNSDARAQKAADSGKKVLDEKRDVEIWRSWYDVEKCRVRPDNLGEFAVGLLDPYYHDYGTSVHAVAAVAVQAANAMGDHLGISGFQAGCIMWEFIQHWMHKEDKPLRLVDYTDLMYPQGAESLKEIPYHAFRLLQRKARQELIDERERPDAGWPTHPDVIRHWQMLEAGFPPAGFTVQESRGDDKTRADEEDVTYQNAMSEKRLKRLEAEDAD